MYATYTSSWIHSLLFLLNMKEVIYQNSFLTFLSLLYVMNMFCFLFVFYIYSVFKCILIFFLGHIPIIKRRKCKVADGWISFYCGNMYQTYIIIVFRFIRINCFKLRKDKTNTMQSNHRLYKHLFCNFVLFFFL